MRWIRPRIFYLPGKERLLEIIAGTVLLIAKVHSSSPFPMSFRVMFITPPRALISLLPLPPAASKHRKRTSFSCFTLL